MYSKTHNPSWIDNFIRDTENRPKYKLREWQKEKAANIVRKGILHDILIPLGNANPKFMFITTWFGWFGFEMVVTSKPELYAALDTLLGTGYWVQHDELRMTSGYAQTVLLATEKFKRFVQQRYAQGDMNYDYNLRLEVTFYPDAAGTCKFVEIGTEKQVTERKVYSMECNAGAGVWK